MYSRAGVVGEYTRHDQRFERAVVEAADRNVADRAQRHTDIQRSSRDLTDTSGYARPVRVGETDAEWTTHYQSEICEQKPWQPKDIM